MRAVNLGALSTAILLTACAPAQPSSAKPQSDAPIAACGADRAARFVGRPATAAVRAEVAAAVGERRIRWIAPGDVVTMDYSESRLNMMLDAGGTITAVKCG